MIARLPRMLRPAGLLLPLLLSLPLLLAAASARAGVVTSLADDGSVGTLRAQIGSTPAGGTVTFASGLTGTITLTAGVLVIGQNLSILGPGSGVVAVDGGHTANAVGSHVFAVTTGTVAISGLTIQNGQAPTGEGAPYYGAGAGIYSTGTLTLSACQFLGNAASAGGGGVYNSGGSLTLSGCTFGSNTAPFGGGVEDNGVGATLTASTCTFTGNGGSSTTDGGGVFVGGVNGTATLTDCTFSGNSGSGVYLSGNALTVTGGTFTGNTASEGAGAFNSGGMMTLTDCVLAGNTAAFGGGGFAVNGGTTTVTSCSLSGNTPGTGTGGGFIGNGGTVTLTDDILYGDGGGEISVNTTTVTANFCDVAGGYAGTGNLNADPKFVRASGTSGPTDPGDLHLQASSPCLGAGTASGAPTTDKDGRMRPNPPSIGAYEPAPSATTTMLTSSLNPSVVGQIVTFTATVTGTRGTPTGAVTFAVDGAAQATVSLSGGTTSYATSSLTAGTHTVVASYGGDPANAASASPVLTQTVNAMTTPPAAHVHLLWSNSDGKAAFWNVAGDGTPTVAGVYGPFTDSGGGLWQATALATGPDGVSHILWNSASGQVALWNVQPTGSATVLAGFGPYTDGSAGNLWRASGLSVGPDSVMHLLWTNTDHKAAFWNVTQGGSPSVLAGYGPFFDGSSPWNAVGVSTGPDNVSHLLWTNPNGKAAFWNVSDTDGSAAGLAGYGPFTDGAASNLWGAVGVSTGPDNVSHLLWDNADGKAAFWNVSDADGSASVVAGYGPYFDGSSPWSATGLATGPDGVSRLLWNNADGHVALWTLGASGSPASVFGFGPYTDGAASNLWSAVGVSAGP